MNRETTSVRAGEEISVDDLSRYLESQSKLPAGEICIEQFPAGSSNLTYLVRIGSDDFVLRRPPFGNTVKTAHDMNREYTAMAALEHTAVPVPKMLHINRELLHHGAEVALLLDLHRARSR